MGEMKFEKERERESERERERERELERMRYVHESEIDVTNQKRLFDRLWHFFSGYKRKI